jgi:hypothetical protein
MRRKSIDEQLVEMEREDQERLTQTRIRTLLVDATNRSVKAYGMDDPLTIATMTALHIITERKS